MNQPVLVTGCSSGIGQYTARYLAERDVPVYATVRKERDAARLREIEGIEPFICDVTDDAQVDRMRAAIEAREEGLWGLVNNAGVAEIDHLTNTSVRAMKELFEVNVFGVHRVTNAVVEMIIASEGRIVNITSILGTLSHPATGVYSMSKHALESYTDSLASQLDPEGVHVCAVVPGNFDSAIMTNWVKRVPLPEQATEARKKLYEPGADTSRSEYPPPDEVAKACHHALFDPEPFRRYLVTPNQDEATRTLEKAALELVQLNRYGPHQLSFRQLLELLK